jgi:phosphatidylglycerophosphate synthase
MKTTKTTVSRIQTSLLSPLESVVLRWLAERMPAQVTPDHLTVLGLLAMFFAGVSYWLSQWDGMWLHVVNFWVGVNWFGDSLDGTVARFRNQQRPRYGFYVDHIIDCLGALFLVAGMALSGIMNETVALGLLVVYFLISIDSYLAAHTIGVFRISLLKLSPTELRILLIFGNLVLLIKPQVTLLGWTAPLFDIGALVAIVGMSGIFLFSVVRNTLQLYRMERV